MINQLIAEYLRRSLEPMVPQKISKLGGMVKVLETDRFSSDKKLRRFPVEIHTRVDPFRQEYLDLVPNEKELLIVYFEDNGSAPTDAVRGNRWNSRIRLVGWGNSAIEPVPLPTLQATLLVELQQRLKNIQLPIGEPVSSLSVNIVRIPPVGTNLFAQYTYLETHSQYLLYPYYSFGLDLSIDFVLNDQCI